MVSAELAGDLGVVKLRDGIHGVRRIGELDLQAVVAPLAEQQVDDRRGVDEGATCAHGRMYLRVRPPVCVLLRAGGWACVRECERARACARPCHPLPTPGSQS